MNLALDRKATQREMTSVLISDLYGKFLTQKDISLGFDEMLNNLADLTIDTPDAPQVCWIEILFCFFFVFLFASDLSPV